MKWLRWLYSESERALGNEYGFIQWLLPLALGYLGYRGQQQAAQTQAKATEGITAQAARDAEMQAYMLGKRKELYDPIERDVVLPGLVSRAKTAAPWAPQAGFWARQLGSKMSFPAA